MSTVKNKIYCSVIEGATHSKFQPHPSAPKVVTVTNTRRAVAGSCSSLMVQKSSRALFQRRNTKQQSENTWFVADYQMFQNVKSLIARAGIDAWAPFFSCLIQWTQPSIQQYNQLSAWLIFRVQVSDHWWCPGIDHLGLLFLVALVQRLGKILAPSLTSVHLSWKF